MELVECIPNVSEGQDKTKLRALAAAITSVDGVRLIHQDSGFSANRTVFTFIGTLDQVHDAALALYKKAFELIDMNKHKGTHPRMAAVDVCPFVPLSGCSTNATIDMSMRLASNLAELGICGYCYEYSAVRSSSTNLAFLRKGSYESLPTKFSELPPDFGTQENWKRFGATVLGVRRLLIAYNINLNTTDLKIAKQIASNLRSSGSSPTKLKAAKAIGWYIDEFNCVQVSFNLYDLLRTGVWDAFEACKKEANMLNVEVTGSELVGLLPLSELNIVAENLGLSKIESISSESLDRVVSYLGLSQLKPFKPEERVLDFLV